MTFHFSLGTACKAGGFERVFLILNPFFIPRLIAKQFLVPRNQPCGPMAFESVLVSLHGYLHKPVQFRYRHNGDSIQFIVQAEAEMMSLIKTQIYASYPDAESRNVTPSESDKSRASLQNVSSCYLHLAAPPIFPLKRSEQFVERGDRFIDPLAGSLSALRSGDELGFTVRAISNSWNRRAARSQSLLLAQQGRQRGAFLARAYAWATLPGREWQYWLRSPIGFLARSCWLVGHNETGAQRETEPHTTGSHTQETMASAVFDTLSRPAFLFELEIKVRGTKKHLRTQKLERVAGTYQVYAAAHLNRLEKGPTGHNRKAKKAAMILSSECLATLLHFPTETADVPNLEWVESRQLAPPILTEPDNPWQLGQVRFREDNAPIGLSLNDRCRHLYIIGKTGVGKSTLIEHLIHQDLTHNRGLALLDPHGDLVERVLAFAPSHRTNDIIVFDPSDRAFPVGLNPLHSSAEVESSLVVSGVISVFKKLHQDSWGPRLEHFLRNALLSLVESPGTTLVGLNRIFVDDDYRDSILYHVDDPHLLSFWETEFATLQPHKRAEVIAPIQNKVGQFLASRMIRNVLGQAKPKFDPRLVMDEVNILLANLSSEKTIQRCSDLCWSHRFR